MTGPDWAGGWDPFHEFQREMGRLFQSFASSQTFRHVRAFPPMNLYTNGEEFVLLAQLPGMNPDEVELTVTSETLTLRGERRRPEGVTDDSYRRQERFMGRWSRTVGLPDRIDEERATAQFADGVLTVRLPRAEGSTPRQIALTPPPESRPRLEPPREEDR